MGTPFAGYVRDPGSVSDNPTDASVRDAIRAAASEYGVPEDAMLYMWGIEAGRQANAYQEVGINSSGYGGFFGLPSNLIGDTRAQTRTVASLLSTYHAQTGSWGAAMNIYNTGQPDKGYGSEYESGVQTTRTTAGNVPDAPISDTKAAADAAKIANAIDPSFGRTVNFTGDPSFGRPDTFGGDPGFYRTAPAEASASAQLPTVSFPSLPDPHIALRAEGAVADRIVPMLVIGAAVLLVIVVIAESV